MAAELLGALAMGALCGAWVLVQRLIRRMDPAQPGVEGCSGCRHADRCDC